MSSDRIVSLNDLPTAAGFSTKLGEVNSWRAPWEPALIETGDFNGDGFGDVAFLDSSILRDLGANANVHVVFGHGRDAADETPEIMQVAFSAYTWRPELDIAVGDFDGDGVDDLVMADIGVGDASLLYGGATAFADLDAADGAVDGVGDAASLDGTNGFTINDENDLPNYWYGDGLGEPGTLTLADLNGDGMDDIVTAGQSFGRIVLGGTPDLHGANALSRFSEQSIALDLGRAKDLVAGDLNGDGLDDLAIGESYTGAWNALKPFFGRTELADDDLEAGDVIVGFSTPLGNRGSGGGEAGVAVGDVNGDGFDDIAMNVAPAPGIFGSNPYANGRVAIIYGSDDLDGQDAFLSPAELDGDNGSTLTGALGEAIGEQLAFGDVNGDGLDDLLIGKADGAYLVFGAAGGFGAALNLMEMNAEEGLEIRLDDATKRLRAASLEDIDGDGHADVVLAVQAEGDNSPPDVSSSSPYGSLFGSLYGSLFGRNYTDDAKLTVLYGGPDGLSEALGDYSTLEAPADGAWDSVFRSGNGDETFVGADGADAFEGLGGRDLLDGGDGDDLLYLLDQKYAVVGRFDHGRVRNDNGDWAKVANIEAVVGSDLDDVIVADGSGMRLSLAGGDDQATGGDGDDRLEGGDGIDRLRGGLGGDVIDGGAGEDFARGQAGDDVIIGGEGDDRLLGGAGDDVIHGGDDFRSGSESDDDWLHGGQGDDALHGGDGDDVLIGAGGHDMLYGGRGADTLIGKAGDDVLTGGGGRDRMAGGDGADKFILDADFDHTRILDFEVGVDQLVFDNTPFRISPLFSYTQARPAATGYEAEDIAIGTQITVSGDRVILVGVSSSDLQDGDILV